MPQAGVVWRGTPLSTTAKVQSGQCPRRKTGNAEKLKELIAHSDARLAEYLKELDAADEQASGSDVLSKAQLRQKIAALTEKKGVARGVAGAVG